MTEPTHRVLIGDCREQMATLPAGSVHCCVTSPPYWALRSYLPDGHADKHLERGLEKTPDEYIASMVAVFREAWRVLRDDGSLWVNIGDSYAANRGGTAMPAETLAGGISGRGDIVANRGRESGYTPSRDPASHGLKHKDLVGIPWRLAFALQADGWYLRQDIIWSKPACMPESVRDRCTKSHEYIFLLTKRPRYFWDAEAVKELANRTIGGAPVKIHNERSQGRHGSTSTLNRGWTQPASSRNRRSVWTIPDAVVMRWLAENAPEVAAEFIRQSENKPDTWTINTEPFRGAHFATFPTRLVEPCILAGTSAAGCCAECGKPWERVVEKQKPPESVFTNRSAPTDELVCSGSRVNGVMKGHGQKLQDWLNANPPKTTGWRPACTCNAPAVPCTVLDPFGGSGTTAGVALYHRRNAILCELNPEYAAMVPGRIDDVILRMRKREAKRAAKKQPKPLAGQKTLWSE